MVRFPHCLPQALDASAQAEPVGLDLPNEGREVSTADALAAALRFFDAFDRRVSNQRVFDAQRKG